jgi:hypothetical protein
MKLKFRPIGVLPFLLILVGLIGLIAFFGSHADSHWGKLGIAVLIAPIPLLFAFILVLAYGEWLSTEIHAYRSHRSLWTEKWFSRLQKFLIVAVVIGFLGLIVGIVDDEVYQGMRNLLTTGVWELLGNLLIAVIFLFAFSLVSFWTYSLYRQRKRKRLGPEPNRIFEDIKNRKEKQL